MLFKRRQEKTQVQSDRTNSQTRTDAFRTPELTRTVIEVRDIAELQSAAGGPISGQMNSGWCVLPSHIGGRSVAFLPVVAGDRIKADARVMLVAPGISELPSRFFFGPIFLDADDNIIQWWNGFDRPSPDPVEISVETTAPEGAVKVRLGMHGTWSADGETADYIVGFANARLEKLED